MNRRNFSERRGRVRDPEYDNGRRGFSDSDWVAGACFLIAFALIACAIIFR